MEINEIEKIYNETLIKPSKYHHVCGGGGGTMMVDIYSNSKEYKCKYQGEKNWMTPACEKCNGLSETEKVLDSYDSITNNGMRILFEKLKSAAKHQQPQDDICPWCYGKGRRSRGLYGDQLCMGCLGTGKRSSVR